MTWELYLGLDLTTSPGKPTAYGVLDEGLGLIEQGFLDTDREIMDCARRLTPRLVAIDAPLFLPLGLCCLEETCPCQQVLPLPGRRAERALSRERISSYYVTKRTFVKGLIYRGMALGRGLREQDFQVIEVFPYATKVRLFGRPIPPKKTARGLAFLEERLSGLIPNLARAARPLNHDQYDAILAAYTAYLYRRGLTEAIGHMEEGVMHVPFRGGS